MTLDVQALKSALQVGLAVVFLGAVGLVVPRHHYMRPDIKINFTLAVEVWHLTRQWTLMLLGSPSACLRAFCTCLAEGAIRPAVEPHHSDHGQCSCCGSGS